MIGCVMGISSPPLLSQSIVSLGLWPSFHLGERAETLWVVSAVA